MTVTETAHEDGPRVAAPSLAALLGDVRATIVELLRETPGRSVTEIAGKLGISAVATRRHLGVLEVEGLVEARTERQERGRPASRYRLTAAAGRLLPHRYDELASEMFEFLTERDGRQGLRDFLRWRMRREVDDLASVVTAEELHERLEQLADALSRAGFAATVRSEDGSFALVQNHCAIEDVAREHPEVCAYEAATFARVLGDDARLSRRETLATGSNACVCTVVARDDEAGAGAQQQEDSDGAKRQTRGVQR